MSVELTDSELIDLMVKPLPNGVNDAYRRIAQAQLRKCIEEVDALARKYTELHEPHVSAVLTHIAEEWEWEAELEVKDG